MNIKLPDFLLAELYGDKLISFKEAQVKTPLDFIGTNKKKVVIVGE